MAGISEIPQGISHNAYEKVRGALNDKAIDELVAQELPEETKGRFELASNIRRRTRVLSGETLH